MTIRSLIRSPIRSLVSSVFGGGGGAPLAEQVASIVLAANGGMYEPSADPTSAYQSRTGGSQGAAGTVLGIALSKAAMAGKTAAVFIAAQAEQRGAGTLTTTGSPTPATYNTSTGVGTADRTDATNISGVRFAFPAGTTVEFDIERTSGSGALQIRDNTPGGAQSSGNITTRTKVVATCATSNGFVVTCGTNAASTSFVVYAVRIIPGFHAVAATDAARPLLDAGGFVDFDAVDDRLDAKISANLGTNVSVYHRTQAGAHVWLTGQTINTGDYALSTTDWRKAAIIPGGVTAGQQATIEAWGAS